MLSSLLVSMNAVFPIMLLMVTGAVLGKSQKLSVATGKQMNQIVYTLLLPIVLFMSIYQSDLTIAIDSELILFCTGAIVLTFGLLMFLIPKFFKNRKQQGVIVMNILRSNCVLFGLQIAEAIYGAKNVGLIAILMTIVVPLFNMLDVFALVVSAGEKQSVMDIVKKVFINPLMIMALTGVIIRFLNLQLPTFTVTFLSMLKGLATPLALLVLGANFDIVKLKDNRVPLGVIILGKLILLPLIVLSCSIALGFTNEALLGIMITFCAPSAVSSYSLAVVYNSDEQLAGQALALTTVLSVITLFGWIFILNYFHLL